MLDAVMHALGTSKRHDGRLPQATTGPLGHCRTANAGNEGCLACDQAGPAGGQKKGTVSGVTGGGDCASTHTVGRPWNERSLPAALVGIAVPGQLPPHCARQATLVNVVDLAVDARWTVIRRNFALGWIVGKGGLRSRVEVLRVARQREVLQMRGERLASTRRLHPPNVHCSRSCPARPLPRARLGMAARCRRCWQRHGHRGACPGPAWRVQRPARCSSQWQSRHWHPLPASRTGWPGVLHAGTRCR